MVEDTAGGKPQSRSWRHIPETVGYRNVFHGIVQGVRVSTRKGPALCEGLLRAADICGNVWRKTLARDKSCADDAVDADAVTQDVAAHCLAAVVLGLAVA